ncbi:Diguanylate cyclase [Altererythrobacter insulae]|nr:Diguanylate cyclase [Altererythrobacter insulae]
MPLKGLLSGKEGGLFASGRRTGVAGANEMSDTDKLAMLDELEESGLGWFWSTDSQGNLTYISGAIAERIERTIPELIGQPLASLFDSKEGDGRSKSLSLKLGSRKPFSGFAVAPSKGNTKIVIRLAGRPALSKGGVFRGFRGTGADITEEYYREEETARLAKYDSLTGLFNRHRMAHSIESTLTAFRSAKRNCAIMMLDLDRFKQVNDTLGHAAGDELLKQVASRLERAVEKDCEIGRLGGDEFQIMLPDIDDRGELGEVAAKVIAMLTQPYTLDEGRCVIGASIGIAVAPHDGLNREEIVRSADLALYSAKNGGRGQYRFYSGDLENEAIFRRRLEENLQEAIRDEQLFLTYQPMVSAKSQKVIALEAQTRWDHPQRGEIDHDEFQSIAENSSHVLEVGKWAIMQACEEAVSWPDPLRVTINVPTKQFASDGFVDSIAEALNETGLAPDRLELEFKESVFLGDNNVVDKVLGQLFKLGVRLTLDEFGTGYSSLGYLRRAPFDSIKIGENLCPAHLEKGSQEAGLVKAVVALAKALDMTTIASSIETLPQQKVLADVGVSLLQGSVYAEAVSSEDVFENLSSGGWMIEPASGRASRAKRRTVLRKIHIIHDDHSYEVTLRNLSKTGALIQGLEDVPIDTQFVVDLGGGQLAVATVLRSNRDTQGVEFELPLIDDGAGGLCTRHRVSPYELASAGAPLTALSQGNYNSMQGSGLGGDASVPKFSYAPVGSYEAA